MSIVTEFVSRLIFLFIRNWPENTFWCDFYVKCWLSLCNRRSGKTNIICSVKLLKLVFLSFNAHLVMIFELHTYKKEKKFVIGYFKIQKSVKVICSKFKGGFNHFCKFSYFVTFLNQMSRSFVKFKVDVIINVAICIAVTNVGVLFVLFYF